MLFKLKLLFIMFLLISCKSMKTKSDAGISNKQTNYYYKEYKNIFYRNCLQYGFNNDACINSLLSQDCGYIQDFYLSLEHYNEIKELAINVSNIIKQDSISGMDRAEGAAGRKIVLNICLDHFMNDKKLDSLAWDCEKSLGSIKMTDSKNLILQKR